jgi:tetratricopeptide (TPR) repeat protein
VRWVVALAAVSLIAQDEDVFEKHAAAAAAAMQSGDYAAAEQHNRIIVKMRPHLAEARSNLGLSYFLQKKYQEATGALEAGLKLKPEMANAWLFLGISHFNLNRPAQAISALEKYVQQRQDDLQGQYYLGLSYLAIDQYAKAEHALRAAREIDSRNVDVLYHLAQTYLGQAREKPAKSKSIWPLYQEIVQQINAMDPKSVRLGQLRAGYFEANGEKSKAIQELETLAAGKPQVRGLHYTLGCLYTEALQYEQAARQFKAELALDSPHPKTYLQLAHVYIATNNPTDALPLLEKSAVFDPASRGLAWAEMGRAYRSLNRLEESVDAFEKAIKFGERDASIYYQLGMVARKAGKSELSRKALETSQRIKDGQQN